MKLVFCFLFTFAFAIFGYAQQPGPFEIGLSPKSGFLMAHRETMTHLVQKRVRAVELEFSRQDTSGSVWSSIYKYPSQGLVLNFQDYGNLDVLGVSFSAFRFTKFPIYQSEKWGFVDFRLGNGISYITKKYEKFNNPKNIAIGSYINGFVDFQFSYTKHFGKFYMGLGVNFSHISNASIKAPNQGLNTLTGFVTTGFSLVERKVYDKAIYPKNEVASVREFSKWKINLFLGIKQNLPDHFASRNFGVIAVQGLYRMPVSNVLDFETGFDLVYNEANRWYYETSPVPIYEAFLLGGYAGMALSLYKTQIYFGIGVYALNLINPAGWVYDRIGLRYNTNEHWNLSVGIKAHIGIADYLEWGIGYRF